MGDSFFHNSRNITFGDNSSLAIIKGDLIHNHYHLAGPQSNLSSLHGTSGKPTVLSSTLKQAEEDAFVEVIKMAKIIVREEVSSRSVVVRLKQTNPFRPASVLNIRRTVQFAEISGESPKRRYTVITFEPEDKNKDEETWKLWRQIYERYLSSERKASLPQLFGLCRSTKPAMVFHEELIDGQKIIDHYVKTLPIVYAYLCYIHITSCRAIFDDGVLIRSSIPLSDEYRDWVFNLNTRSWVYDIASVAFSDVEIESPTVFFEHPPSLPRHCNPGLDCKEILGALPDYLHFISTVKSKMNVTELKCISPQGLLTFGAVVDRTKHGILAHFPVVPSLKWHHKSMNLNIHATFSESVPSRLDLEFVKKDSVRLNLRFSLRLSPADRPRFRVAYLTQSLSVKPDNIKQSDLVFIEEIRFKLVGNFTSDPSSRKPPIHLFVPPPPLEWINEIPFFRWPPTTLFYYWSFDPEGKNSIAKEDWHKYGIPTLKVRDAWVGSSWAKESHEAARDFLALNNYDMDGKRFAAENGYPTLVEGDPHVSESKSTA